MSQKERDSNRFLLLNPSLRLRQNRPKTNRDYEIRVESATNRACKFQLDAPLEILADYSPLSSHYAPSLPARDHLPYPTLRTPTHLSLFIARQIPFLPSPPLRSPNRFPLLPQLALCLSELGETSRRQTLEGSTCWSQARGAQHHFGVETRSEQIGKYEEGDSWESEGASPRDQTVPRTATFPFGIIDIDSLRLRFLRSTARRSHSFADSRTRKSPPISQHNLHSSDYVRSFFPQYRDMRRLEILRREERIQASRIRLSFPRYRQSYRLTSSRSFPRNSQNEGPRRLYELDRAPIEPQLSFQFDKSHPLSLLHGYRRFHADLTTSPLATSRSPHVDPSRITLPYSRKTRTTTFLLLGKRTSPHLPPPSLPHSLPSRTRSSIRTRPR